MEGESVGCNLQPYLWMPLNPTDRHSNDGLDALHHSTLRFLTGDGFLNAMLFTK